MKIYVDCDGVCADFLGLYLRLLSTLQGRFRSREEVTSFEFTACIASVVEDADVWRKIDCTPGLVRELDSVPGTDRGLAALRRLGRVRALTSPHLGPTWMYERAQWLTARGFHKRDIIFCSDKSLVPGDILIEDNLDTCEQWLDAHPSGRAILFDAPYNQGATRADRVAGWLDAVPMVAAYQREFISGVCPLGESP